VWTGLSAARGPAGTVCVLALAAALTGCGSDSGGDAIAAARRRLPMTEVDPSAPLVCQGPCEESDRYRRFMGWDMPWYSVLRTPP
jgi:hypothetical protein